MLFRSKHGETYTASAVGEVNVVEAIRATNAIIGGEGNGGVIYPKSHYGRDAVVGIGLFLSLYSEKNLSTSKLLETYPKYFMIKKKINLSSSIDIDHVLSQIAAKYENENIDTIYFIYGANNGSNNIMLNQGDNYVSKQENISIEKKVRHFDNVPHILSRYQFN